MQDCLPALWLSRIYAYLHSSIFTKSRTEITLRNPSAPLYLKGV